MNRDLAIHLACEGLYTDGGHHKQWYLEQIILALGGQLPPLADRGIAP